MSHLHHKNSRRGLIFKQQKLDMRKKMKIAAQHYSETMTNKYWEYWQKYIEKEEELCQQLESSYFCGKFYQIWKQTYNSIILQRKITHFKEWHYVKQQTLNDIEYYAFVFTF